MSNDTKIEVQEIEHTPSHGTQSGAELLAELAAVGAGSFGAAVEALLLAAADLVIHDEGSLEANVEAARQRFAALIEWGRGKHADCIRAMREEGLQHDHDVH